ncbi:hypothetical protein CCACVL1_23340 [Corchorus capsularis]|uniref:Uncharacterized protein n=1 Tax=Corchorus capsularis TaxID=210143 RepID=A0A1R3GUA2_COCAP|nr:hypothetical protein CCACVL1_23340 [Corchorus capsularis]
MFHQILDELIEVNYNLRMINSSILAGQKGKHSPPPPKAKAEEEDYETTDDDDDDEDDGEEEIEDTTTWEEEGENEDEQVGEVAEDEQGGEVLEAEDGEATEEDNLFFLSAAAGCQWRWPFLPLALWQMAEVEFPKSATIAEFKLAMLNVFCHMPKKGPGEISISWPISNSSSSSDSELKNDELDDDYDHDMEKGRYQRRHNDENQTNEKPAVVLELFT